MIYPKIFKFWIYINLYTFSRTFLSCGIPQLTIDSSICFWSNSSFVFFSSFEFARLLRGKTLDCRSLSEFSSSGARWLDFEWHYYNHSSSKKSFDDSSFSSSKQRRRKLSSCSCSVSLKQPFRSSSSLTDSSLPQREKWSIQKVVKKSLSRNVVDFDAISSLWLSCFSSVYVYI
jgi:hypothetical protein